MGDLRGVQGAGEGRGALREEAENTAHPGCHLALRRPGSPQVRDGDLRAPLARSHTERERQSKRKVSPNPSARLEAQLRPSLNTQEPAGPSVSAVLVFRAQWSHLILTGSGNEGRV